ncbi:hypothetical protein P4204_07705, partial [Pseudomonas aeruginosa]|nr:hypothetical protein [Pseudomonas aeruginosa]
DQWSDPASNPLPEITDALDSVILRPNIGVLGRRTATILRRHPKIVKAYNGTLGDEGMVPMAFLQELPEAGGDLRRRSTAEHRPAGTEPELIRAWGPHASFIYRDRLADTRSSTTFGLTGRWGDRVSGSSPTEHRPARWSARPCW